MPVRQEESEEIYLYPEHWPERQKSSECFRVSRSLSLPSSYYITYIQLFVSEGEYVRKDILSIYAWIGYMIYIEICMTEGVCVEQNRRYPYLQKYIYQKHQNRRFRVIVVYSCWIKIFATFTLIGKHWVKQALSTWVIEFRVICRVIWPNLRT